MAERSTFATIYRRDPQLRCTMPTHPPFMLFGTNHLTTLAVVAMLAIGLPLLVRRYAEPHWRYRLGVVLAVLLLANEAVKVWVRIARYDAPIESQLPLHLCGLALYLTAWMLLRRSYRVYEVVYFWAMGGSVQALVTPDLRHGFPTDVFLTFFAGHGLVIMGVLYATFVYRFRPRLASIARSMGVLAVVALMVVPINVWLDTNFLYLMEKPQEASLMDYLGPWPWYILGLIALAFVSSLVWYLPFAIADKVQWAGTRTIR